MTPVIRLWDFVGLGVIVEYPSGVSYSNQTGGFSCLHPAVEGVFVPLANDLAVPELTLLSPANELYQYFEGPKHQGAGATSGLDEADLKFIEDVLQRWNLGDAIKVDRERLRESHEAWVHVTVQREPGSEGLRTFEGLDPYPRSGILTWPNTD